jgi:hypothetical protein
LNAQNAGLRIKGDHSGRQDWLHEDDCQHKYDGSQQ